MGDLVYFEKDPSKLGTKWIIGRVDQVVRGTDGLIREVVVAYRNKDEGFNRLSNRAVRSLVKLFSIDESCIYDDLAELQRRIERLRASELVQGTVQQVEGADQLVQGVNQAADDASQPGTK